MTGRRMPRAGMRRTGRPGRDRGSVSILFAVGLTGILMIIGLSVDAGGRLRAASDATDLAAAAARTGGQQIDFATAIPGGVKQIDCDPNDPNSGIRIATNYLTAQKGSAASHIDVECSTDHLHLTVTFTLTYQTKVIWMFGFPTLDVIGSATATLLNTA